MSRITLSHFFSLTLGVLFSASSFAQALPKKPDCDVKQTLAVADVPPGWLQSLKNSFASDHCDAIFQVMGLLAHTNKPGGRKLEEDRPLDLRLAQQERLTAAQDPEFAADLTKELQGESDPLRQRLREAALLHEYGYYAARDLLLQQMTTP
jgi:hypothetical protein